MKKKIVLPLAIMLGMVVNGQVAIGKGVTNTSALLDFKEDTKSGIVLSQTPDYRSLPGDTPMGMIFYDCSLKQVLSKGTATNFHILSNRVQNQQMSVCNDTSSQQEVGNGVVIGANDSNVKGVLVLESDNKALLLPKVANAYKEIKSPAPGTLVYDPTNKVLSVYNGETWTFWSNE